MECSQKLLLYHDLITGIVTAMEARDEYTASHSMRVAEITEQLCDFLHLSKEEVTVYHIAAHVHDIGKIGIPDAVLRKKTKLNDQEWEQMKKHPVIGYDILIKVKCFSEIAEIIRHHHERWDGNGYPDGLSDINIPFGSRIIAVADSIDAMMSSRSYRYGMSSKQCKKEIEKNIGLMYDPQISAVALQNWERLLENENDH